MKSFTQSGTDFTTISRDASANNLALGKSLINTCIKKIISISDWTFIRDSKDYTSVAAQSEYDPPYNAARIASVQVYTGGMWYVPKEIRDDEQWRVITSTTASSDIPQFWFISTSTKKICLYPTPVLATNTIRVYFTKKIRDLSVADYTTGTITTTLGSTAITGALTVWTKRMIGEYIKITSADTIVGDYWFEITEVTDATHLTVREVVPVAVAGANYTIAEVIPFPDGYEDIPLWYALSMYHLMREQPTLSREFERMWKEGLDELKLRDARSVRDILEQQDFSGVVDPNYNPWTITLT